MHLKTKKCQFKLYVNNNKYLLYSLRCTIFSFTNINSISVIIKTDIDFFLLIAKCVVLNNFSFTFLYICVKFVPRVLLSSSKFP